MAYYGFKKYTYQRTKTLVVGDELGGVSITSMPAASALAGTLLYNNSGVITPLSDVASAISAVGGAENIPGKVVLLAEDYPSAPSKVVAFELSTRDIDNLEVRTTPKLPVDFDGKPLYI